MKILAIVGGLGLMGGFAHYYFWMNPGWITTGLILLFTVTGAAWWQHARPAQRATPWCMIILGIASLIGAVLGKSRYWTNTPSNPTNPIHRFIGLHEDLLILVLFIGVLCTIIALIWAIIADYRAWQRSV